jgi:hypothetical protein
MEKLAIENILLTDGEDKKDSAENNNKEDEEYNNENEDDDEEDDEDNEEDEDDEDNEDDEDEEDDYEEDSNTAIDIVLNTILSTARATAVKAIGDALIAEAILTSYREETVITDDKDVAVKYTIKIAEATELAATKATTARRAIDAASLASKNASAYAESNIITSIVSAIAANRECRDANELYLMACAGSTDEITINSTNTSRRAWGLIADDSICQFYDACIAANCQALISDTVDSGN